MEKIFSNKVALVTGGSFGIGRATAIAFAARGATVAVADWVEDQETINLIHQQGGKGLFIRCDVSDEKSVQDMVKTVIAQFGRLDFAFNNAGVEGISAPTDACTTENWDRVTGINLKGVWLCMKYEIPYLLKNTGSSIVNNASVAGLTGFANIPAYTASKHGIVGLTKTAALEYAKQGLRVNAVCPGVIRTPMIDRFTGHNKEVEKQFAQQEPVGRLGEPEEVAAAVIWLSSEAASFVTGVALPVDGGWVAV